MRRFDATGVLLAALGLISACGGASYAHSDERRAVEAETRNRLAKATPPGSRGTSTELNPEAESMVQAPSARAPYLTSDVIDRARGGQPGGPATAAPPNPWQARFVLVDLTTQGLPLTIQVPDGAVVRAEFGAVRVIHGARFALELYATPADMEARRRELQSDDVQRLRRFASDSVDTLVYEVASTAGLPGTTEYHFVTNIMAGGKVYRCEDTKGAAYSQAEVQTMLDACHSLALR